MRIVIIGSTGLIGRHLTALGVESGHSIVALSRHDPNREQKTPGVEFLRWDGASAEDLVPLIDGADVIVNLAGENIGKGRWTPNRKAIHLSSRVIPTKAIVRALETATRKPSLLVQASAIGYYGSGFDEKSENSRAGTDYLSSLGKEWEVSSVAMENTSCRRVLIRTGVVLDTSQGVLPQLMLPFKMMVGGPIGSGKQILSWIHIEDEVKAIMYLIEKTDSSGVYNLTAPRPVSNAEMGKAISRITHLPYWMPVPGFALKMVLGEMSTLVLDGQKVLPARLLNEGFQFKFPDIELALTDLLKKQ